MNLKWLTCICKQQHEWYILRGFGYFWDSTSCLYARWMQMARSTRGCTPAQHSMPSSNPLACSSCFSAIVAELLISQHANKLHFVVQKFHSRLIPKNDISSYSRKKAGIPRISFSTRKGCSAVVWSNCRAQRLRLLQGGEDSQDALSCRSFSAKEPLIIGLFSGK